MTKVELLKRLELIERELAEVRKSLMQTEQTDARNTDRDGQGAEIAYTLDDLYQAFGKKKSYALRLKASLKRKSILTLDEFLCLTPGQLFELEGIGFGTLLQTKKALGHLGIAW